MILPPRSRDINGKIYGKLTVIRYACHRKSRASWLCRCECGNEREFPAQRLYGGGVKSCGCVTRALQSINRMTHGESRNKNRLGTKEYGAWRRIVSCCTEPGNSSWKRYGGRGIKVCDEWRYDYIAFLTHIGRAPSRSHSVDRINVYGHYEPGNVCWATAKMQANNKRNSRHSEDNRSNGVLSFGT